METAVETCIDIGSVERKSRERRGTAKPRSRPERRRYNGRTHEARRVRSLFESFIAHMDADDPMSVLAARRAAELVAVAETLRAQAIRGEAVHVRDLIKVENTAARAVRELHLGHKREPSGPNLDQYLASKHSEADEAPG